MKNEFAYKFKDGTLIIEKCPRILVKDVFENIKVSDCKKIVLCEGIEELGRAVFSEFNNLEKIQFPNSLKVIGTGAFRGCSKLDDIALPAGVETLGDGVFYNCKNLKNIILPNSLKSIGYRCFEKCAFKEIVIPDNVEVVGASAFASCYDLKKILLSSKLVRIERECFHNCFELKDIVLPESLKYIGEGAFSCCVSLESMVIPKNVKEVKKKLFYKCRDLKSVILQGSLVSIGACVFEECLSLEEVINSENIVKLGDSAFYECANLKSINLSDNLKEMGPRCFAFCDKMQSIHIPSSVKKIGEEAFFSCCSLKEVYFESGLEVIGDSAFFNCLSLKDIDLPKSVKKIENNSFKSCSGLENVRLPDKIEKMGNYVFRECQSIKKIIFPEGTEIIKDEEFNGCESMEEIFFPSSLRTFVCSSIKECHNLVSIFICDKQYACNEYEFIDNIDNLFMVRSKKDDSYTFYSEGKFFNFDFSEVKNKAAKKVLEYKNINSSYYAKLYFWSKKRYIPGDVVIRTMPTKDIDNFYINNNGKFWSELLSDCSNLTLEENKASFFKLCYILGLFSSSSSIRDRAYNFIKEKIVNVLDGYTIHNKFDGFCLDNGFNEEYAEFFMRYFNYSDFMKYKDEDGNEIDLIAASYNNFKMVKIIYPSKSLHTNRKNDLLLPKHVINVVKNNYYYGVDSGNEELAFLVGKYGYNQEQFSKIQGYFNKGKNIPKENMKLFIGEDEIIEGITYKMLEKNDPLAAILGNITNCCQVVSGLGESCLKYGMTMSNSSFITFNYNDKIIGQAWVWYDALSKTVCLDNIEIPSKYSEDIKHNKVIRNNFISCLLRIEKNFKREMKYKGLEVDRVTIGKGHNDIKYILEENFPVVESTNLLDNYDGYSDASEQYEIIKLKKEVSKTK